MKLVQTGCFAVEEAMPCKPRGIRVPKYFLPSTLDHAETEEAAARVLIFSQQLDQWVGVSWGNIVDVMQAEYALDRSMVELNRMRREAKRRYERELSNYQWLTIVTLGIYALLAQKPAKPDDEGLPEVQVPFSGIFAFGPNHVVDGIHDLLARGFLRQETEGVEEEAQSVFFPTPALVERIMKVQRIAVS